MILVSGSVIRHVDFRRLIFFDMVVGVDSFPGADPRRSDVFVYIILDHVCWT